MVNYTSRVMIALESCMGQEIAWPDRQGRAAIADHFAALGFPGCVGLVDGTLVKLSQRPRDDVETYFDRKSNYSLNVQVLCDQHKRVICFFAGMPGSCHDLTCLRRSGLWRRLDSAQLFDRGQYLLGDSGYVPLERLVCSYKRTWGNMDKVSFNTFIAHAREGGVLDGGCYSAVSSFNILRSRENCCGGLVNSTVSIVVLIMARDGPQAALLQRSGLHDALWLDWSRPEEGTEFVKEFVLNWDDDRQQSTVDGQVVPLNVAVIRNVFGLEEGLTVPRSVMHFEDLSDCVPERSKSHKTWFANDVFFPEWRPIIQLINVVLLGKQKPLEVTGAFIYILKNKVGPAKFKRRHGLGLVLQG
ncbi:hypothetical protein R1sor_027209 [Riccia sorocarpa]|uniref:DDE Tnp4 domain-containing protein n=1 Tax=Riccia sorocarpa TaxID=122646 RepID=A0ABD3GH88_9MARC